MQIVEEFTTILTEINGKTDDYREILVLLLEKINLSGSDLLDDLREANWHDADIAEIANEYNIFEETEVYAELNILFQTVRHAKDAELRVILDQFFNLTINRTL